MVTSPLCSNRKTGGDLISPKSVSESGLHYFPMLSIEQVRQMTHSLTEEQIEVSQNSWEVALKKKTDSARHLLSTYCLPGIACTEAPISRSGSLIFPTVLGAGPRTPS